MTPDMLKAALDDQHVQQLAQHLGVNPDVVLKLSPSTCRALSLRGPRAAR